jgi:hypothetical protein
MPGAGIDVIGIRMPCMKPGDSALAKLLAAPATGFMKLPAALEIMPGNTGSHLRDGIQKAAGHLRNGPDQRRGGLYGSRNQRAYSLGDVVKDAAHWIAEPVVTGSPTS